MKRMRWVAVALLATAGVGLQASSHREAPGIAGSPKLDGTDFYMFRSYETGRQDFVTFLANYVPLQDAYGGPNFFRLDDNGLYEIKIDNDGDGREDITFQFKFTNTVKNFALPIGGRNIAVPLINIGPIGPGANQTANLNVIESYTLTIVRDQSHPSARRSPMPPTAAKPSASRSTGSGTSPSAATHPPTTCTRTITSSQSTFPAVRPAAASSSDNGVMASWSTWRKPSI